MMVSVKLSQQFSRHCKLASKDSGKFLYTRARDKWIKITFYKYLENCAETVRAAVYKQKYFSRKAN